MTDFKGPNALSRLDHAFSRDNKNVLIEKFAGVVTELGVMIAEYANQISSNRLILNKTRINAVSKTIQTNM